MKKFLVLYKAPTSAMEQMSKAALEHQKTGMDLLMQWSKKNGEAIVDLGTPLGSAQPTILSMTTRSSPLQPRATATSVGETTRRGVMTTRFSVSSRCTPRV